MPKYTVPPVSPESPVSQEGKWRYERSSPAQRRLAMERMAKDLKRPINKEKRVKGT